jgi:hypothetical protein
MAPGKGNMRASEKPVAAKSVPYSARVRSRPPRSAACAYVEHHRPLTVRRCIHPRRHHVLD